MNKNWLSTTALTSVVLLSTASVALAANHETSSGSTFIASSTASTTGGIGPELQLQEQQHRQAIIDGHLTTIRLGQQTRNGNAPADYAGGFEGIAAGDEAGSQLSVWTSVNYSEAESDFAATAYKSDTTSGSIGLDYVVSDQVSVGAFLSYGETDTTSAFNGGGSDTQSITFGPYVSLVVDDIFSVDGSIGYTSSSIDSTRLVGAVIGTGKQDGDTVFVSANLNAQKWYGNWGVGGRAGFSYSSTDNDSYTDSLGTTFAATESGLGQLQLGAKLSYYTANLLPYFGATYMYDAISDDVITTTPLQPANDNDEVQLEAGIALFGDGAWSGGLSGNYSLLREEYDAWGIGGNISFQF